MNYVGALIRSKSVGRLWIAGLVMGMFVTFGYARAATVTAKSVALGDVQSAVGSAHDGDTVVIPRGTASWTSTLTITKGITLLGATTIAGDHSTTLGGTPMTANDQTIIVDNVPRVNGVARVIIVSGLTTSQSFRMSGITFQAGTVTGRADNGSIVINGTCPNVRVDHCHISNLYQGHALFFSGWCYGVVDHCIFDCIRTNQSMMIGMGTYGGRSNNYGDGSWADGPNFGTSKFIFVEDSTFNNNGGTTGAVFDAIPGGRYVERYNVLNGTLLSAGHGTETILRGIRALEFYGNVIYPTSKCCRGNFGGLLRSGTCLTYNNTWITSDSEWVGNKALQVYRDFWYYPPWGAADGTNPWDINVTESNETFVPGHSPYLYASGTHTGANGATILTDSTKNWATNQWVNYTVTNTTINRPGMIRGNTNNTITYMLYNDQGAPLKFNNGDGYQIHKVLVPLNGAGRGKGDLVQRVNGVGRNAVNSTTGTASWTHDALEPCYGWDSYNGQAVKLHLGNGQGATAIENREYYNLNTTWAPGNPLTAGVAVGKLADRPAQCTPGADIATGKSAPGVAYWATDTGPANQNGAVSGTLFVCTAKNTWTQYYQPYVYPHPLASNGKPARK